MSRRESGSHPDAWDDPYGLGSVIGNEEEDNTTVEPNAYGVNGSAIPVPQLIMDAAMTARYHGGGSASVIPEVRQDQVTPPLQQFNEQEQIMHPPSDALPQAIMDEGREEGMEKAAKIAILADEPQVLGIRALGESDDVHRRHQNRRETSSVVTDEDVSSQDDPPSLIEVSAMGRQEATAAALSALSALPDYDLDPISQSFPLAVASLVQESRNRPIGMLEEALEERLKQITDMLHALQQRQIEERHRLLGEDPNALPSTERNSRHDADIDVTSRQSLASLVGGRVMEPSGSFLEEISSPKEDAPSLGEDATLPTSNFLEEIALPKQDPPPSAKQCPPKPDPPGRPAMTKSDQQNQGADKTRPLKRASSPLPVSLDGGGDSLRIKLGRRSSHQRMGPGTIEVIGPESSPTFDVDSVISGITMDLALCPGHGAFQARPHARESGEFCIREVNFINFDEGLDEDTVVRSSTAVASRDSGTIQIGDSSNSAPVIAHTVHSDDHDERLRELNDAVAELRQRQTVIDSQIVRAHAVDPANDLHGGQSPFLKKHGDKILIACLMLCVGLFLGLFMGLFMGMRASFLIASLGASTCFAT